MRDFNKFPPKLWRDPRFKALSGEEDARFLYLYLRTCPHTNSAGCFVCPVGYIVGDVGGDWTRDRALNALGVLCDRKLIARDQDTDTIRVLDFFGDDPPMNKKHALGTIRIAMQLPDSPLKMSLFRDLAQLPHCVEVTESLDELKRLSILYPYPIDPVSGANRNTETRPDTETEKEPETERETAAIEPANRTDQTLSGSHDAQLNDNRVQEPRRFSAADITMPEAGLSSSRISQKDIEDAFELFNEMAQRTGLPIVSKITEKRRLAMLDRLHEIDGLEGLIEVLVKVENSSFCNGGNDRGWKLNIDYLLQEDAITKILEGNFDDANGDDVASSLARTFDTLKEEMTLEDETETLFTSMVAD